MSQSIDAREIDDMPCKGQGSGKTWRFDADEIHKRWTVPVDRHNEVAPASVRGDHGGPDPRVGPPKPTFSEGRNKFTQCLDEHVRRSFMRRVIPLVLDWDLVRSYKQLAVGSRAQMNAFAGRMRGQGRIDQTTDQWFLVGCEDFVIFASDGTDPILVFSKNKGRDRVGVKAGSVDQARGADRPVIRGDRVGSGLFVDGRDAMIEGKRYPLVL